MARRAGLPAAPARTVSRGRHGGLRADDHDRVRGRGNGAGSGARRARWGGLTSAACSCSGLASRPLASRSTTSWAVMKSASLTSARCAGEASTESACVSEITAASAAPGSASQAADPARNDSHTGQDGSSPASSTVWRRVTRAEISGLACNLGTRGSRMRGVQIQVPMMKGGCP